MNVLQRGEILASIRLPGDWAGSQFYFEKVRDRQVWDFALVSVASAMTLSVSCTCSSTFDENTMSNDSDLKGKCSPTA